MALELYSIVPEGVSGEWSVSRHIHKKRSWARLRRGDRTIMSDHPGEIRPLEKVRDHAHGHVLISGLGLGLAIQALNQVRDRVERITIIEKSVDVAKLVWPFFQDDPRLELIIHDALTWEPPTGAHYGAVWHDIWDKVVPRNIPEMILLEKRYADICDWQDCWDWNKMDGIMEQLFGD